MLPNRILPPSVHFSLALPPRSQRDGWPFGECPNNKLWCSRTDSVTKVSLIMSRIMYRAYLYISVFDLKKNITDDLWLIAFNRSVTPFISTCNFLNVSGLHNQIPRSTETNSWVLGINVERFIIFYFLIMSYSFVSFLVFTDCYCLSAFTHSYTHSHTVLTYSNIPTYTHIQHTYIQ